MTRLAILLRSALLILTLVCVSQTMARSQKYKVTIKAKEQRLLDVFKTIQKQTNLIVFYSNTILNDQEKVSIQVKDEALEKVLDQIIAGKQLKYDVQEKYIVISPKEEKKVTKKEDGAVSAEDVPAPPPTIDVSGRITDEDNNPLFGASIMIKGTKTGTQTNGEGYFIMRGVDEKAIIQISYVGFENRELSAAGLKTLNTLSLKRKEGTLNEVIVRPYSKEQQRFSVSATTRITAKEIERQPVTNPLLALQGRIPGLEITQGNGFANGALRVRIQGDNSIASSNSPLIVVDGVPLSPTMGGRVATPGPLYISDLQWDAEGDQANSPVGFINPSDIESIDILMDADATSIYGSRAANGAILITTKKGKAGKVKVSVNMQQGFGKVTRKMKLLNTRQYLDMRYEAYRNDGIDWTQLNTTAVNDLKVWDTTRYTDWQTALIGETASYTTASANFSGGTNAAQYLIGGTFTRTTDVFPGSFANQSGVLHLNLNTTSFNQKFKMSLTAGYMVNSNGTPTIDLTSKAILLVPHAPSFYNPDGTLNWELNASGTETWTNPLINTQYGSYNHEAKALNSNAQISYALLPGLNFKLNLGFTSNQLNSVNSKISGSLPPRLRSNSASLATSRTSGFMFNYGSTWIAEPQINFKQRIGKGLIDGILGSTIQNRTGKSNYISASGFASDQLVFSLASATTYSALYDRVDYKYAALFGRINYNLNNKYIINLSTRRDGSSRFGDKNKFSTFWSVGGAWLFSEEKGLMDWIPVLSFGKIRASYGTTGNDQTGDYLYLPRYSAVTGTAPYQGNTGLAPAGIADPYLQWEGVRKISTGFDLGFFKDKVQVGFTYYYNRSSNGLSTYALPVITGVNQIFTNFPATVQNTGIQLQLSATPIKTKTFTWISSFNISANRNKVVSFPDIENSSYAGGRSGVVVGEPIGVMQIYRYMGIDPVKGNYLFQDVNGKPSELSSQLARIFYISPLTEWSGGWSNTISYKGFTLDFNFRFVRRLDNRDGYYLNNGGLAPGIYSGGGEGNQPISVMNRWQKPGDINKELQKFTTVIDGSFNRILQSDAGYTYDASFIRLSNASLTWQFPAKLLNKTHLESGSVFFRGQNLLTITKYKGLDPETGNALPPLQIWTFGFRVVL